MTKVIVENQKKEHKRPKTTDSTMFVDIDGKLRYGYYLRDNRNAEFVFRVDNIVNLNK